MFEVRRLSCFCLLVWIVSALYVNLWLLGNAIGLYYGDPLSWALRVAGLDVFIGYIPQHHPLIILLLMPVLTVLSGWRCARGSQIGRRLWWAQGLTMFAMFIVCLGLGYVGVELLGWLVLLMLWIGIGAVIGYVLTRGLAVGDSGVSCCTCEYDLTGNTSGVCPECGTPCVHVTSGRERVRPR